MVYNKDSERHGTVNHNTIFLKERVFYDIRKQNVSLQVFQGSGG